MGETPFDQLAKMSLMCFLRGMNQPSYHFLKTFYLFWGADNTGCPGLEVSNESRDGGCPSRHSNIMRLPHEQLAKDQVTTCSQNCNPSLLSKHQHHCVPALCTTASRLGGIPSLQNWAVGLPAWSTNAKL